MHSFPVALRKESVDRNSAMQIVIIVVSTSLSARRAWIEMQVFQRIAKPFRVALRKESVDRNANLANWLRGAERRSPQGERG